MTRPPCVSVVMANYNGARHIGAAVASVLSQTLSDFELLIADDASTDDSLAEADRAAGGDPRVKILAASQNGGPGAARNRALAQARGDFVAVFDSDDLMAPDRLERLVCRARGDRADIVVDNLLVFEEGRHAPWRPFLCTRDWNHPRWITLADYIAAGRMYAKGPGLGYLKPLFRRAILDGEAYREDLRIGEDYDLVLRLLARGARMRFQPEPLYRYRKHAQSVSHVLRREHIERMLAADAALELPAVDPEVRRAQAARRRSLEAALVYDEVIAALKAKAVGKALSACAQEPAVWPLLAMPVKARLRRLADRASAAA
jgi:succinoglycan biosynthesis protein ExoO